MNAYPFWAMSRGTPQKRIFSTRRPRGTQAARMLQELAEKNMKEKIRKEIRAELKKGNSENDKV